MPVTPFHGGIGLACKGLLGRRFSFTMEAISVPLVRRMIEDMVLEPLGDARCRFRYHVYYEPRTVMRLVHPIARAMFTKTFREATRNVARLATG